MRTHSETGVTNRPGSTGEITDEQRVERVWYSKFMDTVLEGLRKIPLPIWDQPDSDQLIDDTDNNNDELMAFATLFDASGDGLEYAVAELRKLQKECDAFVEQSIIEPDGEWQIRAMNLKQRLGAFTTIRHLKLEQFAQDNERYRELWQAKQYSPEEITDLKAHLDVPYECAYTLYETLGEVNLMEALEMVTAKESLLAGLADRAINEILDDFEAQHAVAGGGSQQQSVEVQAHNLAGNTRRPQDAGVEVHHLEEAQVNGNHIGTIP